MVPFLGGYLTASRTEVHYGVQTAIFGEETSTSRQLQPPLHSKIMIEKPRFLIKSISQVLQRKKHFHNVEKLRYPKKLTLTFSISNVVFKLADMFLLLFHSNSSCGFGNELRECRC